jgi:hypothetical protein
MTGHAYERWSRKWRRIYSRRYEENGRRHQEAFDYAWRKMRTQVGDQPPAPPVLVGLGFRFFWLLKVKGMDWKKLGLGSLGAFAVGAVAALGPLMSDGQVTQTELVTAVGAGLAALGLFLKDPNAHKGKDPRQKPGITKLLSK